MRTRRTPLTALVLAALALGSTACRSNDDAATDTTDTTTAIVANDTAGDAEASMAAPETTLPAVAEPAAAEPVTTEPPTTESMTTEPTTTDSVTVTEDTTVPETTDASAVATGEVISTELEMLSIRSVRIGAGSGERVIVVEQRPEGFERFKVSTSGSDGYCNAAILDVRDVADTVEITVLPSPDPEVACGGPTIGVAWVHEDGRRSDITYWSE
ncbi:MAG: hypothetical protein O3A28_11050 [Actinomycetota bacterium]|nr:hypothetical protein [Actinomycetota bacterium]MDA3008116.1 hypothetical protein [Actinomycetota bacterium]MDA3035550.1 hypothetical protein [Actinomycetota bacterium]